jgi:hypothetical protein
MDRNVISSPRRSTMFNSLQESINSWKAKRIDMEKYVFNYDEWLNEHSKRKTMMEKLERSLVPFDIFDAIGLVNDK